MRWIGQHIWDFISRFRNDVYLENVTESAQDYVVGIDAGGKLYKQDASTATNVVVTDDESSNVDHAITFVNDLDGSTSVGLESDGHFYYNPALGKVVANTFDASLAFHVGSYVSITVTSASFHSNLRFLEEVNSDSGPIFTIKKTRGGSVAAQDDDKLGEIRFESIDDKQPTPDVLLYSKISSSILDASDGNELGKLDVSVANNGTLVTGLNIAGRNGVAGSTDVTLGSTGDCRTFITGSDLESPDLTVKDTSPLLKFYDSSGSVTLGNVLVQINWYNEDSDSTTLKIIGQSTENFTASVGGSKFSFWVTPTGSTTPWQALTINDDRSLDCANNVTIDGTGSLILKQNAAPAGQYSATMNVLAVASNSTLTTPTSTGTIALTSELPPNLTVDGAGTIHANNVPTLNQNTTGTAAGLSSVFNSKNRSRIPINLFQQTHIRVKTSAGPSYRHITTYIKS